MADPDHFGLVTCQKTAMSQTCRGAGPLCSSNGEILVQMVTRQALVSRFISGQCSFRQVLGGKPTPTGNSRMAPVLTHRRVHDLVLLVGLEDFSKA